MSLSQGSPTGASRSQAIGTTLSTLPGMALSLCAGMETAVAFFPQRRRRRSGCINLPSSATLPAKGLHCPAGVASLLPGLLFCLKASHSGRQIPILDLRLLARFWVSLPAELESGGLMSFLVHSRGHAQHVCPSVCLQEASSHKSPLLRMIILIPDLAWSWLFLERRMMERRTMGRNERTETNKVMERNQGTKRNQLLWLGGLSRIKPWLVSVAVVAFYWCQ